MPLTLNDTVSLSEYPFPQGGGRGEPPVGDRLSHFVNHRHMLNVDLTATAVVAAEVVVVVAVVPVALTAEVVMSPSLVVPAT